MTMRITTKMMQSKSLYNINNNKTLQEKLTTQLSTMKKITRPSDDPVIAIRSLKLNSTLNKIDQYYEKNSNDAESWLKLTESAISTTNEILTGMRKYIIQIAQGSLEASNRAAILENLSNYRKEIYSTGNADSDGRSIFTGYRTNTALTFQEDEQCKYEITEQRTNACLDTITYVRTGDLAQINDGNFQTKTTTEYDVDSYQIARIRTAYSDLDYNDAAVDDEAKAKLEVSFLVNTTQTAQNNEKGITINTTSYSVFAQTSTDDDGKISFQIDGATPAISMATEGTPITTTTIAYPTGDATYNVISSTVLPAGSNVGDPGTTRICVLEDAATGEKSLKIDEYSNLEKDAITGDAIKYKTTMMGFSVDKDAKTISYDSQYETKLSITDYKATSIDPVTNEGAYMSVYGDANADKIVYVAETGEILLGSNIQAQLAGLDIKSEIRFTYEKSNWKDGDLNPVHYFYSKKYDDADKSLTNYSAADTYIEYNEELLTDPDSDLANQIISYDIGNNQTIRVNTVASDLFTHNIGRDIDETLTMLEEYITLEDNLNTITEMISSGKFEDADLELLERQKAALEKASSMAKSKLQDTCEGMITSFDGYISTATLAQTDAGARSSRLSLIKNRLSTQQTNYSELVSENEDADVTDLAIQLSSVQLTYQASLSAISYVMKTSLLDFI